jgi:antitoxin (DNA-binding transcriptional repressor) of toxin-antitoxin stability system
MKTITVSQLRENAGRLAVLASLGKSVVILVNGVAVAMLGPLPTEMTEDTECVSVTQESAA